MKRNLIRIAIVIIGVCIAIILTGNKSYARSETYINQEYVEYCREIGNGYDIDYWILVALIERESSGDPNVADYVDGTHIGLMQLSIYYFGGDGINLTDPYTNIMIGTRYLASLNDSYGDIGIALMAYHGECNVTTKPLSSYASGIINRAEALRAGKVDKEVKQINKIMQRSKYQWKEVLEQ